MSARVRITGGREVAAKLARLEKKTQRKLASGILRSEAKKLADKARGAAPRDSGALRKALTVRVKNRAGKGYFSARVTINPRVYRSQRRAKGYAPDWVERYWRFVVSGATIGKERAVTLPPNPFPTKIAEAEFEGTVERVTSELRQSLNLSRP